MKKILFILMCLSVGLWAQSNLKFEPEMISLGKLEQGETKKVSFKIHNTAKKDLELDMVLSQNIGSSNFKYPKTIAAGKSIEVSYEFNSAYLAGKIQHRIIAVDKSGQNHILIMSGEVNEPIRFSEPIQDVGYFSEGDSKELTLYAWATNLKKMKLAWGDKNPAGIKADLKEVSLNIKESDQGPTITEGGSTPAYKITLKVTNLKKKSKSIRELIAFKSSTYPKATPEMQVIGYWK